MGRVQAGLYVKTFTFLLASAAARGSFSNARRLEKEQQ